jgi:hypothetical protein
MRTTITIDDELLAEAKAAAAKSGRTLNAVVEDALREALARRQEQRPTLPIPTFPGRGWVRPGVNIDSNAELQDLMDEDEHWFSQT